MRTLRGVMVGVILILLGGVGEALAQIILPEVQQRAEQQAEGQVNELRAQITCHGQWNAERQQAWAGYNVNRLMPGAKDALEAQLAEAQQRFRECDESLVATRLEQSCLNMARTEAQRAKCR